jgi:aminoglycoside phosphotransferase
MTAALAIDPVVPQRDELLDAEAVGDRLSRLLGGGQAIDVRDCRRVYARYRPGRRLRLLYRVDVDGEPHHVAASTFRGHDRCRQAFAQATRDATPSGSLPPVVRDATLDTIFWTFPNDPRIGSLRSLDAGSPVLGRLLGTPVTPRLVSYVPERAATAACIDGGGATIAYAKVYGGTSGRRAHRVQRELTGLIGPDDPWLRLPGVLAWAEPEGTLVSEAVEGRRVSALRGPALDEGIRRFGAALAQLHRLTPRIPMPIREKRRRARLIESAEAIVLTRPDAAADAQALLRELLAAWPASLGRPALMHGDAALHNAHLDDGCVVLRDLDNAALGPASADLGRVVAWLRAREVLGRAEPGLADRLSAELILGYGEAGRLPSPAELRWHVAASLLTTRAARAVTWFDPDCAAALGPLLHEARELVG